jgi:hypothetical protein
MPTPEQKDAVSAPPSQKNVNTGTTDKPSTTTTNSPKIESTGAVKSPTGNTVKAAESVNKTGVITGDKTSTPTSNDPFEKSFSSIKGEVLQGDSFRITLKRGNKTIRMPVPIEGTNNIIVLSNTFKLIEEMLNIATEKELDEKFHSFVE